VWYDEGMKAQWLSNPRVAFLSEADSEIKRSGGVRSLPVPPTKVVAWLSNWREAESETFPANADA
jgi:hypothetical protein